MQARGFYVWTDDIWDQTRWSDPVYYDATGIDQDVGLAENPPNSSSFLTTTARCG